VMTSYVLARTNSPGCKINASPSSAMTSRVSSDCSIDGSITEYLWFSKTRMKVESSPLQKALRLLGQRLFRSGYRDHLEARREPTFVGAKKRPSARLRKLLVGSTITP
jgi:hypothetical protein